MEALRIENAARRVGRFERRADVRRATDLPALASFDGRVVCCTVLDASGEGARLSPTFLGDLPDEFTLRIPARPKTRARVVRRDGGVVGVAFLG